MKNVTLDGINAETFAGILKKSIECNGSMVFPSRGKESSGSKFGSLRRETSVNPMKLTTKQVEVSITDKGIRILNPLNRGFGYSDLTIPFGKVVVIANSYIWKDSWGYWRQVRFEKAPGWALYLSGGHKVPYHA